MARQAYGMHAPVKMMMEKSIVEKVIAMAVECMLLRVLMYAYSLIASTYACSPLLQHAFRYFDGQGRDH